MTTSPPPEWIYASTTHTNMLRDPEPHTMDAATVAKVLRQQADRIEAGDDPIRPTEITIRSRYGSCHYRETESTP